MEDDLSAGRRPWAPIENRLGLWTALLLAAAVTLADQASKELAVRALTAGRFVPLLGDAVGWQLTHNKGGAFGLPLPWWVFLVVTIAVVVLFIRNLPVAAHLGESVGFGLLLAGALGNALDRVFRPGDTADPRFFQGHVVDFVAWGSWPRFNLADAAITIGFAVLAVSLWRSPSRP